MGALEEREAMVEGVNLAIAYVRGYIAARADANRTHVIQNVNAVASILHEDLTLTTAERGARTEAFLVAIGDLAQLLVEAIGGDDGRQQLAAYEDAVQRFGARVNEATDRLPPPPIPGWDSAACQACGRPVFEREAHTLTMDRADDGTSTWFVRHRQCDRSD